MNHKICHLFIFFLTLSFTFILRSHNYNLVPTPNHLDEQLYAWSGIYLIETGLPVSWSDLDYPKRAMVYQGKISYKGSKPEAYVTLYRPWLDEPPLFSLIIGWFAHINHAIRTDFIPSSYIRIPTLIFAAFTSVMIFLIARFISGFWTGILSMLIYGTVPIFIFASRSAMPENLIALLFTVIFYLMINHIRKPNTWYIMPIPFLIGLSGLSKPTGYLLLPIACFLAFTGYYMVKDLKSAIYSCIYIILATMPFIGAFLGYGYLMDPQIFNRITSIQASRPVGFGSLAWFFITPSLDTKVLPDSWFVFCLLSAAYFIFSISSRWKILKESRNYHSLIVLAFIYWVIIVMISGGENDLLAWYRFPSYPFLAIIGAWGLQFLVQKADFFASFLAAGLLLGNRVLLVNAFRDNIQPFQYRVIFSLLLMPSLADYIFQKSWFKQITQALIIGLIVIGIYFNIKYVYNAFEISCENLSCPIVPSTKLSSLHFPIIWRFLVLGKPDRY